MAKADLTRTDLHLLPQDTEMRCRNGLLRSLRPEDLRQLWPLLESAPLKPRRVLHYPNVPMEYVYFIEDGLVSVLAAAGGGKSVEVWLIGPEGVVGVPMILGEPSSPHRRLVQVGGTALRIRSADLRVAMHEIEGLHDLLLRYVRVIMIQTSQLAACNAVHSLQQRLARWLLMAQDRCRSEALPLTHDMLSRMLGVRRATVSESILALEQENILGKARSLITILDRPRLEEIACVCYGIARAADDQMRHHCGRLRKRATEGRGPG